MAAAQTELDQTSMGPLNSRLAGFFVAAKGAGQFKATCLCLHLAE